MSIPLREPDLIPVDKRLALVRLLNTIISAAITLSLIHISEPTRLSLVSRMPSSA